LIFYVHVTPNDALRNASIAAEEVLDKYAVEVEMREDVYQSILHAEKNIKESGQQLTPEEKRLVEKMVLEGKRAGLALPAEKREQLKEVRDISG
jgi:Zn-dependent oligopeptidase